MVAFSVSILVRRPRSARSARVRSGRGRTFDVALGEQCDRRADEVLEESVRLSTNGRSEERAFWAPESIAIADPASQAHASRPVRRRQPLPAHACVQRQSVTRPFKGRSRGADCGPARDRTRPSARGRTMTDHRAQAERRLVVVVDSWTRLADSSPTGRCELYSALTDTPADSYEPSRNSARTTKESAAASMISRAPLADVPRNVDCPSRTA